MEGRGHQSIPTQQKHGLAQPSAPACLPKYIASSLGHGTNHGTHRDVLRHTLYTPLSHLDLCTSQDMHA